MSRKLYQAIASRLDAMTRCNVEGYNKHADAIKADVRMHMPRGSGFDSGTTLDFDSSKPDRLVFATSFHHMDDNGYYDGWTDHEVIVTPSLALGINLRVTGRDRREIKDYIAECFRAALYTEVE